MATFCLVHGAWHDDACWALLVAELERRGHTCVTPVLPLEDPAASFGDYAAAVIECAGASRRHFPMLEHPAVLADILERISSYSAGTTAGNVRESSSTSARGR